MEDDEERQREGGSYSREYEDSEFLEAVREHAPATTGDVADAVGCHRATARRRLETLAEEGRLDKKRVSTTTVWTLKDSGADG